ncbi:MAG: WYL domain-containing protein [Clostridiales bacterium]|nr:WYL domain-containing protein [Candidatus Cacconaster stercorequi]
MANKKLKLLYLAQYLQQQTDEQHPKTVADMIDYLAQFDISAERKSVYDDLHLLEQYGMDIQTVKGKSFGYFLGERAFQLPELKTLIDVVQSSPFLSRGKSMELIGKLETLTSRPTARQLRRQVYVMNRLHTSNEQLYYAVDGINTAINENRQVSFRYFDWTVSGDKAFRRGGAAYVTNPVALCVDRHYYLVAYDAALGDYRHYRVDRIANLTVTDTPRDELPRDFDLGSYVKTIFDMYNGETVTVVLRMHLSTLNAAMDRFGADAHMRTDGTEHFVLSAPVEVGPTFYGWLFQFGDKAAITGPEQVRSGFTDYCRTVLAQYQTE